MKQRIMRVMKLLVTGGSVFAVLVILTELFGYISLMPERNLTELSVQGIDYFPYEKKIPVKRSESKEYADLKPDLCIQLQEYIPGSIVRNLKYYGETNRIRIEIWWTKWSFIAAKESFCYEITAPEIHEELLHLIASNQDLFTDPDYERAAHCFANDHADTLRRIGNGNRFFGMQRIGFFDWFRAGKDPECEWQKMLLLKKEQKEDHP